jgi:hypothetical protein
MARKGAAARWGEQMRHEQTNMWARNPATILGLNYRMIFFPMEAG